MSWMSRCCGLAECWASAMRFLIPAACDSAYATCDARISADRHRNIFPYDLFLMPGRTVEARWAMTAAVIDDVTQMRSLKSTAAQPHHAFRGGVVEFGSGPLRHVRHPTRFP